MRIEDLNDYEFDIYYIDQVDILNVDLPQIKIVKLEPLLFITKIMYLKKSYNKIEYKRFLVSFEAKN